MTSAWLQRQIVVDEREGPVPFELIALASAGLFAGAALYITLVEHPARLECRTAVAIAEFVPSYRRAE
jgi:hypothetical protein